MQLAAVTNEVKSHDPVKELDTAALTEYIRLNWSNIVHALDVAKSTKRIYRSHIRQFIDWLDMVNINTVRNYKAALMDKTDISARTKAYKIAAVKVLFSELHTRYRVLPLDIGKGVKLPKYGKGHVKSGLSHSEVKRVKRYIASQPAAKRFRLNAMFHLLALQALRQNEVATLEAEKIDFASSIARVQGKTGADQIIHLLPDTIEAIRAYMKYENIKSGYLFRNKSNSSTGENRHIAARSVRRIFTSIFKALDIDRSVHGFRHYCVTRLLQLGFTLDEVMSFARITDVNTIKAYNDRIHDIETVKKIGSKFKI